MPFNLAINLDFFGVFVYNIRMKPKDIKMAMTYTKDFKVSDWTDVKPTEKSHKEILEWVNERRPYCPNDFKRQSFIPNLRHIDEKQR